jgi:hypothetical protein
VDITNSSGLSGKSNRRTFSASLIDLDFDQDLDLIVVADFSGLDLYLNDGKGHFSDITEQLGKKRHAFGMSHTFGDWNSDGDFYHGDGDFYSDHGHEQTLASPATPTLPSTDSGLRAIAKSSRRLL